MKLTGVTLTGADTTVDPQWLIDIAVEFPFVEWGILIGSNNRDRFGAPRFPTFKWIEWLSQRIDVAPHVNLSLHVCGQPLRSMLAGQYGFSQEIAPLVPMFQRWQLNFHGQPVSRDEANSLGAVLTARLGNAEAIVQLDSQNDWILDQFLRDGIKASGLYDTSHGAGILPSEWPKANPNWKVGYAGGIGPANVVEAIDAITPAAGGQEFWIDMETKLRSDSGHGDRDFFDMKKCRRVLEECAAIVQQPATT